MAGKGIGIIGYTRDPALSASQFSSFLPPVTKGAKKGDERGVRSSAIESQFCGY